LTICRSRSGSGHLSEEQVREQPHAGSLFHVRLGLQGRVPFRFAG
jgi:hypothetical protein